MAIHINTLNNDRILIVEVSGKLATEDYKTLVPEFERLVRQNGKLRVLFDMSDFHGWEMGALWQDIKFDFKHSGDIERLAMVGEKKWQAGMAQFCRPFTTATIRYFNRAAAEEARAWILGSDAESSAAPQAAPHTKMAAKK